MDKPEPKAIYEKKTQNRVRLIYVDEIPDDIKYKCLPNTNELFDSYDHDAIRGMLERNIEFKLSEHEKLIYTSTNLSKDFIYFENAAAINSAELIMVLAKFPNAQIVMFLPKLSETSKLSVVDTNLNELNVESWRKALITNNNKSKYKILDVKRILENFEDSVSKLENLVFTKF